MTLQLSLTFLSVMIVLVLPSDEQSGCFRAKFKPKIHIREPQGHNVRALCLMYMLNPFCNLTVHWPLSHSPLAKELHFHTPYIRVHLFFYLINWLDLRVWPVVCYNFAFWNICLFHLLRNTRICFRHFCAFWLWLSCWVSPHGPSHLGFVQYYGNLVCSGWSSSTTDKTSVVICMLHAVSYLFLICLNHVAWFSE